MALKNTKSAVSGRSIDCQAPVGGGEGRFRRLAQAAEKTLVGSQNGIERAANQLREVA